MLFALLCLLTGFAVKLTDILVDDRKKFSRISYAFGIFYGFLMAYTVILFPQFSSLVFGVLFSVILTKKIDTIPHVLGVVIFFVVLIFSGLPSVDPVFFSIFLFSSICDEIGNDIKDRKTSSVLYKIIGSRILLEVSAMAISYVSGNWYYFLGILLFDIAYIATEKSAKNYIL